ncbi:MAG: aldehyde dehydrogenase [Alphaproteobacteria bacterium]
MPTSASEIENTTQQLHVGGVPTPPLSGRYLDSYDPSTGRPWYRAPDAGSEDVDCAVEAAHKAFQDPAWRRITQSERGRLLRRLADLIAEHHALLAEIETRDNGKLIREMRAQVAYLPDVYHYFAGMADKLQGDVIPINKRDMLNFTVREPMGVVAVIVPWNSPLYVMSGTVAPCLAVGNTVVVKPSEHTSASALAFAELVAMAGFPPGTFNVVTGYGHGAGEALARHPKVAKVAFTGGTETGRRVAASAAEHLAPTTMELGGKSPHVVFEDADLDRATNGLVAGIFAAAGQSCVAGSRCFVQRKVHDEVVDRLLARTRAIRIGHPLEEETQLGPLALEAQLDKVKRYVGYAKADGAKLVIGGKQPAGFGGGWYYEPTVFTGVGNDMRVARDEIFGPVAAILAFEDEHELVRLANDTTYGLAAGIWTRDIDRALRLARDIDAGTVWINTYRTASFMSPMGGFKESGYGKHNGFEAMREYSRLKNVMIDYSGTTQDAFVMRVR